MFIPDPRSWIWIFFHPGSGFFSIPDLGVKKLPDPESRSATLQFAYCWLWNNPISYTLISKDLNSIISPQRSKYLVVKLLVLFSGSVPKCHGSRTFSRCTVCNMLSNLNNWTTEA
jgi:hypothetical protein